MYIEQISYHTRGTTQREQHVGHMYTVYGCGLGCSCFEVTASRKIKQVFQDSNLLIMTECV